MSPQRWPTLFIPHGGGPCFFMDPPPQWPRDTWDRMAAFLRGLDASLGRRPSAVLVISGHWETDPVALNTAARPPLLFDYYGFPEHTYRLTYPVDGAPKLAEEVRGLLAKAGLPSATDPERGLDHGVFVPFKLIYPDADVPILQMSLRRDLDPATHLAIGAALAPLRDRDVLIVGSGMSYHNLQGMFSGRGNADAEAFDAWLGAAVTDPGAREGALARWREAPGAVESHPEAEHLLPLMVAAGAASGEPGARIYSDHVLGKALSGFRFG
ncbi:MAG: Aromatic ring-opening dioxygenase, catalytic subunit, LigB family [Caulobacteraceae bacterium]|nr:Aromatic ring-opening dioxygenase, catalytic subunit, LigB family [Caulobacteraceae bacterium]